MAGILWWNYSFEYYWSFSCGWFLGFAEDSDVGYDGGVVFGEVGRYNSVVVFFVLLFHPFGGSLSGASFIGFECVEMHFYFHVMIVVFVILEVS